MGKTTSGKVPSSFGINMPAPQEPLPYWLRPAARRLTAAITRLRLHIIESRKRSTITDDSAPGTPPEAITPVPRI